MKLNYKRTFMVGLAFFLICVFWQAYDTLVSLTLINKFGMNQTLSGIIMSLDNILALFMLPLFGSLSDKSNGRLAKRYGKRTPFIVIGTIVAVFCFFFLSVVDYQQMQKLELIQNQNIVASNLWEENPTIDNPYYNKTNAPAGFDTTIERGALHEIYNGDFASITLTLPDDATSAQKAEAKQKFANVVVPVRQAYAGEVTDNDGTYLTLFIVVLLFLLFAMATFRSPAVALMPAVTPKPLRSKANAIINIMGVIGGALVLVLGMVFGTGNASNAIMNYIPYISICIGIMVVALIVFLFTVKEPRFVDEMEKISREYNVDEEEQNVITEGDKQIHKMSKDKKKSLIFLMLSIALWFFGYNAITSKYAVYAQTVILVDYNYTLLIAQVAAMIAFLPTGMLATKIGRKRTIMGGIILLTTAFTCASFINAGSSSLIMNGLFVLAGIAWAAINVNSLPMVVELATGADVGKYTGFYYTASMAAQIVTPILSGKLMDWLGMRAVLFPYGAIFVALSFVTMLFVKHGDSKPIASNKLEALAEMDVD